MNTIMVSLILVAAPASTLLGNGATEDYVAHEWGTFTSVQRADGALLEWNSLATTELPTFVYDWNKPGVGRQPAGVLSPGSKGRFATLQRMETPVIYFYSDKERTVDVSIKFPLGLITEWYPQAEEIGPSAFPPNKLVTGLDQLMQRARLSTGITFASMFGKKGIPESRIRWKQVRILPAADHGGLGKLLPIDETGNHYFAARETDAAFVRVQSSQTSRPAEYEKLLFYRGVANFKSPLYVTLNGPNEQWLGLKNTGTTELRHLFVLSVRKGQGKFLYLDRLEPDEYRSIDFDTESDFSSLGEAATQLGEKMKDALTTEGLYQREAAAMVKTWRDSWFQEEGLRVLYTLPRVWTDDILPLTVDPKPREIVRVMVGRAEITTPTTEWELLRQIVHYAEGDSTSREKAIAKVREFGLGRFILPAMQGVLGAHPSQAFNQAARELVDAAAAPRSGNRGLARW